MAGVFEGFPRDEGTVASRLVSHKTKTSQPCVAKMEQGDPTVSPDLLLQAQFRIGMKRKDLAAVIGCVSRDSRGQKSHVSAEKRSCFRRTNLPLSVLLRSDPAHRLDPAPVRGFGLARRGEFA